VAVLVPLEDGVFGENVGLVEQEDDLVERLEEVHVVVAVFLETEIQIRNEQSHKISA